MRALFILLSFLLSICHVYAADSNTQQDQQDLEHSNITYSAVHGGKVKGYAMDEYGAQELNNHSASMLLLEGQTAFHDGDLDNAMHKVKRALELNDDDIDAHLLYANIMDEQLRDQTEKDPTLYNKCVQEWLDVMRNRYGDEKGMRFRGVNPFGDLYHDEDRSIVAKRALVKLTGYSPKTFETDAHYLKRVLMPTTQNVSGAVVSSKTKVHTQ